MKPDTTFWLALAAFVLALVAVVLRLAFHRGGTDYFGIIGPAAIVLFTATIMARHRHVGGSK